MLHQLIEALADANHQRVKTVIGKEQIGTEAERKPRHAGIGALSQCRGDIFCDGRHQHGGRTTDPVGRPARQRLGFAHLAADTRAKRRNEVRVARCSGHPQLTS